MYLEKLCSARNKYIANTIYACGIRVYFQTFCNQFLFDIPDLYRADLDTGSESHSVVLI